MNQELLVVRIGPYFFGAPVLAVAEILQLSDVTRIPRVPPQVAGIAVVRGLPLMVMTLSPALGLPAERMEFVLRWAGDRNTALVHVDEVVGLVQVDHPLPKDSWATLVPPAAANWVVDVYRWHDEWLWAWPEDLPQRLAAELTGGLKPGGSGWAAAPMAQGG
ncbi:MAG: chemotaxis protein CheW [Firmicutes bacterium]|nr:chemotaxis protein CheW [Bacillota bacterium]